jgi:hypothetical protein
LPDDGDDDGDVMNDHGDVMNENNISLKTMLTTDEEYAYSETTHTPKLTTVIHLQNWLSGVIDGIVHPAFHGNDVVYVSPRRLLALKIYHATARTPSQVAPRSCIVTIYHATARTSSQVAPKILYRGRFKTIADSLVTLHV